MSRPRLVTLLHNFHASLDPGVWKMGLAISRLAGPPHIEHACAVRVEPPWTLHAAVEAVLGTTQRLLGGLPQHWAIEHPRVYPGMGRVASSNDVEKLGDLAKLLAAEIRPLGCKVRLVRPEAWKGQMPKPVYHRRMAKYLTPSELPLLDAAYGDARLDVLDAIGIELFATGRCGRGAKRTGARK